MDNNSLYQIYLKEKRTTKEQIYRLLAKTAAPQAAKEELKDISDLLVAREAAGDLFIARHVILPHIESHLVTQSRLCIIQLAQPIADWQTMQPEVQLIVAVLLKQDEQQAIKEEIRRAVRKLANEEFLKELQVAATKAELLQLITDK